MYYADYHTHSSISPDSTTPLIEDAKAAVAAGLSELCITDHFDLLDGTGARQYPPALNWPARLEQYEAVKAAFAGKLVLKLGMEYGSGQVSASDTAHVLDHPELDFVIGSLHNRPVESGGGDFYYVDYTSPEQCYPLLDEYFLVLDRLVEADCYDVLGHIIYPVRYMRDRDGQDVDIYRYMDRIRAVLKGALERGKGIELNTWCGRTLEEWRPLLAAYRELGGEIVTVGSDAHVAENIAKGLPEAYTLLQDMGFRYVATYEKRRPVMIKL